MRLPSTRSGRLLCAWAVAVVGGLAGMLLWSLAVMPYVDSHIAYSLSAVVCAGAGVAIGALAARRLLSQEEWREFTRPPPDDSL